MCENNAILICKTSTNVAMKAERRNVVPLFVSLPACFCLHATHILYPARPASVHTDTPHQPHSAPITHVSHINIKHTAQSVQHPVFRPPRHHPIFCIFMQNGLHRCISIHRQPRENRVFAAAGTVGRKYASFTHHHIICCKSTNYTIMTLNAPSRSCETGFPASR